MCPLFPFFFRHRTSFCRRIPIQYTIAWLTYGFYTQIRFLKFIQRFLSNTLPSYMIFATFPRSLLIRTLMLFSDVFSNFAISGILYPRTKYREKRFLSSLSRSFSNTISNSTLPYWSFASICSCPSIGISRCNFLVFLLKSWILYLAVSIRKPVWLGCSFSWSHFL